MIALGIGGACLVAFAILTKLVDTELIREGQLFDFTTANVQQIKVVDGVEIYLIPEVKPTADLFNGLLLFGLAGVAFLAALVCGMIGRSRRDAWMFGLLSAGAAFLSLDEIIGIHDSIGANLRFLADLPGINSPDDPVFAFFGVIALAYFWFFRRTILGAKTAGRWIAAGLVLFGVAAALDLLDRFMDENMIEVVSTMVLAFGFSLLAIERARFHMGAGVVSRAEQAAEAGNSASAAPDSDDQPSDSPCRRADQTS